MRFLFLFCVGLIAAVPSVASASILADEIFADGRLNILDDISGDIGVQLNGGTYEISSGALGEGDFLVAAIGFENLFAPPAPGVGLTGVGGLSVLKIASATPNGAFPGLTNFVFEAPSVVEWNAIVGDIFGLAGLEKSSEGTVLMLFDDSDTNFTPYNPPSDLVTSVSALLGKEILEIGFTGSVVDGNVQAGAGEGWIATGPSDPSAGGLSVLAPGTLPGTSFTAAANRLEGWDDLVFIDLPNVFGGTSDFIGSGLLTGYGLLPGPAPFQPAGPWQIANDAQISFAVLPEPVSTTVWGVLALGAVGAFGRGRRS